MKKIFTLLLVCITGTVLAQYDPLYIMFSNNYSNFNAAASGLFYKHYLSVLGRPVRVNKFDPLFAGAAYEYKWNKINSGFAVNYAYSEFGYEKINTVKIGYSYHIDLKKDRILSAGVSFGRYFTSLDFSKLIPLDEGDPVLPNGIVRNSRDNINVGLIFKAKQFFVGMSGSQFINMESTQTGSKPDPMYYFISSYTFKAGTKFKVIPSLFCQKHEKYYNYNINCTAYYVNRYWLGISYAYEDIGSCMGGIDIKGKFRVGYAYIKYLKAEYFIRANHEFVLSMMLK